MKDERWVTLVTGQKLKSNRSDGFHKDEPDGHAYKLAEDIEDDNHGRKRGESGEEFDVVDTCEAWEGEDLQREDRRHVSCHLEGDGDRMARPVRP